MQFRFTQVAQQGTSPLSDSEEAEGPVRALTLAAVRVSKG